MHRRGGRHQPYLQPRWFWRWQKQGSRTRAENPDTGEIGDAFDGLGILDRDIPF